MSEYNRFSEHYRIDQYLKKKSSFGIKTKSIKRNDNVLSNFPIGLIIISKEESNYEDKLDFINQYACKLFAIKDNTNIKELKEKFGEFVKLTKNSKKSGQTLRELIFNYSSFNVELDYFIPFECTYSKNIILYIKINEIGDEKYIVIDKYDKYIEESKYIELSLIKTINYQYLHTLYHELNNPLNALLSLSGDKNQFNSSNISNSRIENKPSIIVKKTMRQKKGINTNNYRKDKTEKTGITSLSSQKLGSNQDLIDCKTKKKFEFENSNLNDKITLLVNIIKIFIKNFILYLKTRADNLLMIKNQFNSQSETSDIMNAVEVSEYERELTKHKCIKLNLEYVFNLYLEKFLCLFKYKEIEVETNFEKLKNLYVITDEFNFIYYIRQIYTYLYYIVPKKEGFAFDFIEENNSIKIIIKKSNDSISKGLPEFHSNISKTTIDDMHQIIQTKEMTKEVLYSMSKRLNFLLEINDKEKENSDNNNIYLTITMPIHQKDKTEEDDEFKDDEISEMVQKNAFLLEDKLKRPFQNFGTNDISTIHAIDLDKTAEDKKDTDSFISFPKRDTNLRNHSNNHIKHLHKVSAKNLNSINENTKKTVLSNNKTNDNNSNFLNKCLKSDFKNAEKEKEIKDKGKNKNQNLLKIYDVKPFINHRSDKNVLYSNLSKSSVNESKSQMLSGVFTKINNFGCSEVLDCNDISISNNTDNNQSNNQEVINNQNALLNDNKFNLDSATQYSTNLRSNIHGVKNSKLQNNSNVISEIISPVNKDKNINININNNNIINIINNDNNINQFNLKNLKKQDLVSIMNKKIEENDDDDNDKGGGDKNKTIINDNTKNALPEIDNMNQKRFSHNISPQIKHINPKDCMTFFSNEKKDNASKDKKTIYNDNIRENDYLFEEAKKERKLCLKKKKKNICVSSSELPRSSQFEEEELEEGEEYEEIEDLNQLEEEKEEEEQFICNCSDILIVDDEKFNVMASQRMFKNIGYQTDAAYNGEECINLIKEKQQKNCKCGKNHYKLILLDIVMPVLDGISTAKKVQEMITNKEINDDIKIVFVSGNIDGEELKNSLLQIECVKECLQKPVGIDKYRKILEKYYK